MKLRVIVTLLIVVAASLLSGPNIARGAKPVTPPAPPTFQAPNVVAQIYPYEGHQGDPIYVSGKGFRPNSNLILLLACPSYLDPHVYSLHNYIHENGPTTTRDGNFTAYEFKQKLYLHGETSSSCLLYVSYPDMPAADFPVPYTVLSYDEKLPKCVRQICASVKVREIHLRGRAYEHIAVQALHESWAGATALISITYPHLHPNVSDTVGRTLGWEGSTTVNIPVRSDAPTHAQGTVHVSFKLGPTKGNQFTRFTIR